MGIRNKHFSGKRIKAVERNLKAIIEKHQGEYLSAEEVFLDVHDFLALFQINKATLRRWREQKLLPYSKIGGKYFFKIKDIREFVERHERDLPRQRLDKRRKT